MDQGLDTTDRSLRLDRLLCYLRFARTRSRAQSLIKTGHMRVNGMRVARCSHPVHPDDVLTCPNGKAVVVARIMGLPDKRCSAIEARNHYAILDPQGQSAIAAQIDRD